MSDYNRSNDTKMRNKLLGWAEAAYCSYKNNLERNLIPEKCSSMVGVAA